MNPKFRPADAYVFIRSKTDVIYFQENLRELIEVLLKAPFNGEQEISVLTRIREEIQAGLFEESHLTDLASTLDGRVFNVDHDHEAYIECADSIGKKLNALSHVATHNNAAALAFSLAARTSSSNGSADKSIYNESIIELIRQNATPVVLQALENKLRNDAAEMLEANNHAFPTIASSPRVKI